jgi:hypothetical protein
VPELVAELQQRASRIRALDVQIAAARRTPDETGALLKEKEVEATARLHQLQSWLTRPADRRDVCQTLFPDGIKLHPDRDGSRQIWKVEARPFLGFLAGRQKVSSDPEGTRTPVFGVRGRRPRPLDDGAMFSVEASGRFSGQSTEDQDPSGGSGTRIRTLIVRSRV